MTNFNPLQKEKSDFLLSLAISNWIDSHTCDLKFHRVKVSQIPQLIRLLIKNKDKLLMYGDALKVSYNSKTKTFKLIEEKENNEQ